MGLSFLVTTKSGSQYRIQFLEEKYCMLRTWLCRAKPKIMFSQVSNKGVRFESPKFFDFAGLLTLEGTMILDETAKPADLSSAKELFYYPTKNHLGNFRRTSTIKSIVSED